MSGQKITITANELKGLIAKLIQKGYRTIGPVKRDEAIIYDDISSVSDLPLGWKDEQNSATYRLRKSSDQAYFGYTMGIQSWKRFLHQPQKHLWSAIRDKDGFGLKTNDNNSPKMAFVGVRPCELAAIEKLDKALLSGPYVDFAYASLRKNLFIVAVNCSQAGGTCFCASMNCGPKASSGFDLALTELAGDSHRFVIEIGSASGADVAKTLSGQAASNKDIEEAEAVINRAARHMGRTLDTSGIKDLLNRNSDSPHWDRAAQKCLTCGNCTMVCPTCFCTTVEDTTDLAGKSADRVQKWDSCFTIDFSYIHGGSIRTSTKARYRQMVMHKLAAWDDQFGGMGCVGCGRCITWCPAAIDITEEVRNIRESERTMMVTVKAKEGKDANA